MGKHAKTGCLMAPLALVAMIGVGVAACSVPESDGTGAATSTSTAGTPSLAKYREPKTSDFGLKLKITSKECFGTAGCNIAFRVTLVNKTGFVFDPSRDYSMTYDVKGGSDPMTQTITVLGGEAGPDDEMIQTNSAKFKLVPVLTAVDVTE